MDQHLIPNPSFGVPLGSLIGPLLFIIYINDVPSVLKHCKIQMYADDTLLYVSSSSISEIESMLSEDLKRIIERLNNNFLYLNYSKTKVLLTGTDQRLALVDSFTVRAGDTVLSRVYQFKLDPFLSWNDHIYYIGRKIWVKLGMLRKARKVIPRESCLTLYNAMILPVFDYCPVVRDSCSKADREYLDKLHRRAASIIEGYAVSYSQISYTFGWPTLPSRRDYLKCMLVFKSLHGLAPAYLLHEFSHARDFPVHITRAMEICSVCR